jgi:hypothetical protein
MDPALEKLFNTPIKITSQSKRIIGAYPNFASNYLQKFFILFSPD